MVEYVNKVIIANEVKMDLTGDTVTADQVAAGITFHGADGAPHTGTSTYDSDTSDATVTAAELLAGKTAYARGVKLTGTMPNKGGISEAISTKDAKITIPQGYHDGSGKVSIAAEEQAKLIPGNILNGVEILGVTGTCEPSSTVTAQTKSVTPAMTSQVVLPDEGIDYLSQVTVGAIPISETPNAAGGTTLKVG